MLIFNCTKASSEFFTVTRQGEKFSCIEPAPHKTISESVAKPTFPDDVDPQENDGFQWQWIVHCVSIKRKKYLLVMDHHTRYCVIFPAGKKGDDIDFLNNFETLLKANFRYLVDKEWVDKEGFDVEEVNNGKMDQTEATRYIEQYDALINTCIFHQRGDRSVQSHINDVVWHLQALVERQGHITERLDCLMFSVTASNILRRRNGEKDYFQPNKAFFAYWLKTFSPQSETEYTTNNVINLNQYRQLHE